MTTRAERLLAVEHWLLSAAPDRDRARQEWRQDGVALLRCGSLFGAVRISAEVVHAAAGTDEPAAVDLFLDKALLGGPVFADREKSPYYALVGATAGRRDDWRLTQDDAAFMGVDHFLGVPDLQCTSPDAGRLYWCVEMDSAGELAPADAVSKLVHAGRRRMARGERKPGE